MTDPDRRFPGAGGEPPLTLGARRAARSRGPAPVSLIVSVVILVIVIAAVFWLYRSGSRGPGGAPQPVGASIGDVRVAAPPQSQTPDPAAGLSIYKEPGAAPANPAFAPPPEEPTARPTEGQAAAPQPDADRQGPPAAPDVTPRPAAPHGDALSALIDRTTRGPPARPQQLAQASGETEVQIGAFSSEAAADTAWTAAASAAPGAMAGHGKRVVPLSRDGVTLYRTFITGFASRDAAQALCDRLRTAGRTCILR
jgi:hypothetical protein